MATPDEIRTQLEALDGERFAIYQQIDDLKGQLQTLRQTNLDLSQQLRDAIIAEAEAAKAAEGGEGPAPQAMAAQAPGATLTKKR